MNQNVSSFEAYIVDFSAEVQEILTNIRAIVRENAPDAVESILYGMPAYKTYKKPLVYFAAFKNHIGFYATPSGHSAFEEALRPYKQGKGSVQFPLNQPIPYTLIAEMVRFRVAENEVRAQSES